MAASCWRRVPRRQAAAPCRSPRSSAKGAGDSNNKTSANAASLGDRRQRARVHFLPAHRMLGRAGPPIQIGRQMWAGLLAQEIGNNADAGIAQHLNAPALIFWMWVDQGHVYRSDAP